MSRQSTLAFEIENGIITHLQAFSLIECLYASIVFDGCCQIKLEDYDSETDYALSLLSESFGIDDFNFEKFYIQSLDFIKTDDKDIWRLYALTTPYSFIGHSK